MDQFPRLAAFALALAAFCIAGCQPRALPASSGAGTAGAVAGGPPVAVAAGSPAMTGPFHVLEATAGEALGGVVIGTGSVPLSDAFVYFLDPEDRYYAVPTSSDGEEATLLSARTDAAGTFRSPPVFPTGTSVIAGALLAQNRRLLGFVSVANGASVSVNPAATHVIEFLRDQRGPSLAPALADAATRQVLISAIASADGAIPDPRDGPEGDLVMGKGYVLANRYVTLILTADRSTSGAWRRVLGRPVRAMTTFAGNYLLRFASVAPPGVAATSIGLYIPSAVTEDASGDTGVYLAEEGNHQIKRIKGGLVTTYAGCHTGDPTAPEAATLSADATPVGCVMLRLVRDLKSDPDGNLAMTFGAEISGSPGNTIGFICRKSATYFGVDMVAEGFYRLGAPDGLAGYQDGPQSGARFRHPHGLTFDGRGNLYVADKHNNRIRRIDRASGLVSTVLGDGWPYLASHIATQGPLVQPIFSQSELGLTGEGTMSVTDRGRFVDQPAAGDGAGLRASFNRPAHLAWREVGPNEELYILDSNNNAIRKATGPGGEFSGAAVTTLIGMAQAFTHAQGYSVPVGRRGSVTDGDASSALLNLSLYDPETGESQPSALGLAIDRSWNRLYIADSNNRAIRLVDLVSSLVTTVAAHDPRVLEGDARRVSLSSQLAGLAVLADHNVLIVDQGSNVVRMLHTAFDR